MKAVKTIKAIPAITLIFALVFAFAGCGGKFVIVGAGGKMAYSSN